MKSGSTLVQRFGSHLVYGGRIANFLNWVEHLLDEVLDRRPYSFACYPAEATPEISMQRNRIYASSVDLPMLVRP